MKTLLKVIQEVDQDLLGSFFDPVENYEKKIQVDLRKHLKDYLRRAERGAVLLLSEEEPT